MKIPSLDQLIHSFTKLPGIGEKTAQRLSYYVLKHSSSYIPELLKALQKVESSIQSCKHCFAYTENSDICTICEATNRDSHIICVIEDPADILKIEAARVFQGRYHVLHGALSPLDGILPEDLKIEELLARIKSEEIIEVILALDADLEGDTTSLYLTKLLSSEKVKITRIAYGIPFGTDIDFIDKKTLGCALENRVEL